LHRPEEGNQGVLIWGEDRLAAIIDWQDPVVSYGLSQRIKYARLIRRKASTPAARGADCQGDRYYVQLALEGTAYKKPKQQAGTDVIGWDLGPSTLAIVSRQGQAQLGVFCEELSADVGKKRRLQRKLERQRRANNPEHYNEQGRIKKHGNKSGRWKESQSYKATRRRLAHQERKLAAHRKSLHGRLVNHIVRQGNTIHLEKVSYKAWQKQYGKSVGLRAPGLFVDRLKRTVAKTGGTLHEVPTKTTKLSQYCHGCGSYVKKPLAERWHSCAFGIGPVQRDLYSALLAAYLNPPDSIPSITREQWEGAETRLRAVIEVLIQRAKEGQVLPRSIGIPRARARLHESLGTPHQELGYRRARLAAL
jgi:hypothetical protein